MRNVRVYYSPQRDTWVVDSWLVMTKGQLDRAGQHALKLQRERVAGMPPGDRREVLEKSIQALEAGRIVHRPIAKPLEREMTVFSATAGTGRIIVGA